MKSKLATEIGPATVANVTLAGQVDSGGVRAKTETVAESVPKVVRVIGNVQVTARPQS
jgi:hypothetical protein